jgi:Recombination endonuclease VII
MKKYLKKILEEKRAANARWRRRHPEQSRAIHRKCTMLYRYGLTPEKFEELQGINKYKCWACNSLPRYHWKKLHIDHCHLKKKVRGLLCFNCNTALGLLEDSPRRIKNLLKYLKKYG